jgi:excisionase family DNA binding protein
MKGNIVLFTPREVADMLTCSENHVYRLIARGALRAVDIAQPGSRKPKTRVRSDDLESYIDACTRTVKAASR